MKILVLSLSLLSLFWGNPRSEAAPVGAAVDICASPHLKSIVAAIQCKRDSCSDDAANKEDLYQRACTEIEPGQIGEDVSIRPSNEDTMFNALYRVNDSSAAIEVLERTRLDKPIKSRVLPPCDCLEKIEKRVQCGIELCKAPAAEPAIPVAEKTPNEAPASGKEVTPQTGSPKLEGSCSLNGTGDGLGLFNMGMWILSPGLLLSYRFRKNLIRLHNA